MIVDECDSLQILWKDSLLDKKRFIWRSWRHSTTYLHQTHKIWL